LAPVAALFHISCAVYVPRGSALVPRMKALPGLAPAAAGSPGLLEKDAPAAEALRQRVTERLRGVLGIVARVTLKAPGTLPRSEGGKLRRVVDERPKE